MSTAQHTAGPWRVESSIYEHMAVEIVADRGIAQVWASPVAMDDARLIAAAPDMLAALKQVEREMRAGFGSSFGETREQVRRVIAKAESSATRSAE